MTLRSTLSAIISDLLLWGIILAVCIGIGFGLNTLSKKKGYSGGEKIVLRFQDVSQLTVGSPVNFMGTYVGYVKQVKQKGDSVEVVCKTYPNIIAIPKGAHFTIEFNGLAGAETLEVLPPTVAELRHPAQNYVVEEPIRLKDVTAAQMILAKSLQDSMNFAGDTLKTVKTPKDLLERLHMDNESLMNGYQILASSSQAVAGAIDKLNADIPLIQGVQAFNKQLDRLRSMTTIPAFNSKTHKTMRNIRQFSEKGLQLKRSFTSPVFQGRLKKVYTSFHGLNTSLQSDFSKILNGLVKTNVVLSQSDRMLKQVEAVLCKTNVPQKIQRIRQQTKNLSQQTQALSKKFATNTSGR
jgi:ABC-type transporter Mla subunit MlaD